MFASAAGSPLDPHGDPSVTSPPMDWIRSFTDSRKVVLTLLAAALVILNKKLGLGLDSSEITTICATVGAGVIGLAIQDHGLAQNRTQPAPEPPKAPPVETSPGGAPLPADVHRAVEILWAKGDLAGRKAMQEMVRLATTVAPMLLVLLAVAR